MTTRSRAHIEAVYYHAAQDYLRSLPLEHFMEAIAQATQREITLESFALVRARRPDVQVFNELLVQYPLPRRRIGQIVPDNMVVVWDEPIDADGSFDLPLQPTGPFWVLEYVSKHNKRKDYEESFDKYEQHLKVPYYLLFYPDGQDMTLYRMRRTRYHSVPPDDNDRCPIEELELEVGLLDGWVRYWFRGELLPLPGDLMRDLDRTRGELERERQRRQAMEAENARLRAELARLREQKKNGS